MTLLTPRPSFRLNLILNLVVRYRGYRYPNDLEKKFKECKKRCYINPSDSIVKIQTGTFSNENVHFRFLLKVINGSD
jgi:hypothetical protein